MKNLLNTVKIANPNSNVFDLSHDVKTSFKMGYLIPSPPILCSPGDKFKLGAESLVRFAPMVAPVMHRFDIRHEYFFVPFRLLWDNWEKYITLPETGETPPAHPYQQYGTGGVAYNDLLDYMGLPPFSGLPGSLEKFSALPIAAYQKIYNDYYRPAQFVDEVSYKVIDGLQDNTQWANHLSILRKRAWEHDYFTAALPEAQKGDPVMIPIGSQKVVIDPLASGGARLVGADDHLPLNAGPVDTNAFGDLQGGTPAETALLDPNNTLITEDAGEATSINDLRLAYALQKLKEKLMRGGSRLTEYLRVVFGVFPQDARLDRAEYITGVKAPLVVSEVLNTTGETGASELPQGNMAGHGVAVVQGTYGHYFVPEHGVIICISSVIPRSCYQNGIHATWDKYTDPTEYFVPDMAHIGEQEIKGKEIFAFGSGTFSSDTWGYMPRFSEYKTMPSFVTGDFRQSLSHWHDGRIFTTQPSLNQEFIECTPSNRIFAVAEDGEDKVYAHIYHKITAIRKMPKFGTPTY